MYIKPIIKTALLERYIDRSDDYEDRTFHVKKRDMHLAMHAMCDSMGDHGGKQYHDAKAKFHNDIIKKRYGDPSSSGEEHRASMFGVLDSMQTAHEKVFKPLRF